MSLQQKFGFISLVDNWLLRRFLIFGAPIWRWLGRRSRRRVLAKKSDLWFSVNFCKSDLQISKNVWRCCRCDDRCSDRRKEVVGRRCCGPRKWRRWPVAGVGGLTPWSPFGDDHLAVQRETITASINSLNGQTVLALSHGS
ncbi:hypothetical protein U1Q18_031149 [Sarracenia purpurea var. burkii]